MKSIEAVGYPEMMASKRHAKVTFTDSGDVRREACFHGMPCMVLREETEWVETAAADAILSVGTVPQAIEEAVNTTRFTVMDPRIAFGDARTGEQTCRIPRESRR